MAGAKWLFAMLLYDGGLWHLEALCLHLDIERGEITARECISLARAV